MDAKTIYSLLKPHLDLMGPSEKRSLSNLINGTGEGYSSSRHRRVIPLNKAKEKLKLFCKQEMELERNKGKA